MNKTLHTIVSLSLAVALYPTSAQAAEKEAAGAPPRPKLIKLDYVNAEVSDVIRALATQSGVNIALNPSTKGQVTVHMRDKTVDEAMMVVSNLAGLSARKVGDTYVVAPKAEIKQTLSRLGATRQVDVANISSKAAADMAESAFPDLTARPQGKAVALTGATEDLDSAEKLIKQNDSIDPDDVKTVERIGLRHIKSSVAATALTKMNLGISAEAAGADAVVLAGPVPKVASAKRSIELIDVPQAPDMDIRLYHIKYSNSAQLIQIVKDSVPEVTITPGTESYAPAKPALTLVSGTFLNNGQSGNQQQSQQQQSGQAGATGNGSGHALSLIVKGPPASVDQAMKVLALSDVAPRQVMIELKVVETSPDETEELGFKWNWTRFSFTESGGATRPLGFGAFSRVPWSFESILSAMITKKVARLLASPSVAVLNDQDAQIFIGDTLRFQSLAQSGPNTGNQFTVVEVPVGIILLCHPRINDDGYITLRVHPVVSSLTGLVDGLPQTSAREAETTIRLKDGETFVLGGLIRDEDIKQMSKIPLLGDLPVIGQLFRNKSNTHRRTEVMVSMTVHEIK
jgi:general secretion pathway protein D